jgi:hypothetical protein
MNWEASNIFLYFILNMFDLWVILRYFNRLMELIKLKKIILYCMYFLFLAFFTLLIKFELKYSNIVSIAAWSIMFLPTYKGKKRNKLVYSVLLLGFAGFSQMTMFIVSHSNTHTIYSYFIPHFIFFIIVEIGVRCQTIRGKILEPKLLALLISIPLFSFIAMPCMVLISEQINNVSLKEETTMLIPITVLILYMNIIVFYLYDTISSTFEVKRQKDEYEQQLIWQQNYYDSLAENQDAIRKIKHDMQNNLQVVSSLLIEKKVDEAGNYLKELLFEQAQVKNLIMTGNDAIDTVLNIKLSLAQKYSIKVEKDINIPAGLPIPYHHCVRLFGNLLDNAINALKDQEEIEKTIKWFMFFKGNALIIQISNQYKDKPVKYNRDSFLHGLGLDIVKTTTELYNGTFEVEDDGKNFTVNIMLYLDI